MAHRQPGTIKRSKGLGGSDVAVFCGLSTYKTPLQLYLEKRGEFNEEIEDTTRLRFGRRLEKPVADEFAFITGRKLWRERITQRHEVHRFMLANIDRWQQKQEPQAGYAVARGVYEGKTADWRQRPLWTSNGIPESYYLQLQWYLAVTGCPFGSYGILFGLDDFHFFDVDRDEATITTLTDLALDFWRRVQEGDPPDHSYGMAGAELVRRLYQRNAPGKTIMLEGAEAETKIRRLLQLKQAIKTREEEERDLTTWLQIQMQDAEIAHFHGLCKITWKNQTRTTTDMTRLKAEYPEIVEQLAVQKETRVFRIAATDPESIVVDETPDEPLVIQSGIRAIQLD
jgi:putative phage-type endonuclease